MFLMSQLPPCSRGGMVRAASPAAWRSASPVRPPSWQPSSSGGSASGGTRFGSVAISARSRLFHVASSSWLGAVPISPGWVTPAKRTPGMWREVA